MFHPDPQIWALNLFGNCALGDTRRTRRLVDYASREAMRLSRSTNAACQGNDAAAEGAYRLIRNPNVDPDDIAEGGFQATVEACRELAVLLAVEDSSTLAYSHGVAEQLGDLGGPAEAEGRGYWVHSVLILDGEKGKTVGLAHQDRWIRPPGERRGSAEGRKPTDPKESAKWQHASECVAARMGESMARVISVCDREADIYQYIDYKTKHGQRFVVRSCYDRSVGEAASLWTEVTAEKKLGEMEIVLAQRGGKHARPARKTKLAVRAKRVTLKAPKYLGTSVNPSVELWAVHAVEESPPEGEEALEWLLLTSEAAEGRDALESALKILKYYSLRWRIEDFHKAWKSGCGVEDRRMQTADNLERVAVVLAFVAVRLLQLTEAVEADPNTSCEKVLSREEWTCLWVSTEKKKLPSSAPSILWARQAIARLGGWRDTKRTGRVGWQSMSKGWLRLADRLDGFRAAVALMGAN